MENYIKKFAENVCGESSDSYFDFQLYLETLELIPKPQINSSQVERLAYVAGYVVFSYLKKSNACADCHNFLTSEKQMEVVNDMGSQFILIDLLDRGSLKYPSIAVIDCVNIVYETFMKIDSSELLSKKFFVGPCRTILIRISMKLIEDELISNWRECCDDCEVWRWDILKKIILTVSNCILSKKVKNYNNMVVKSYNSKLKKYSN